MQAYGFYRLPQITSTLPYSYLYRMLRRNTYCCDKHLCNFTHRLLLFLLLKLWNKAVTNLSVSDWSLCHKLNRNMCDYLLFFKLFTWNPAQTNGGLGGSYVSSSVLWLHDDGKIEFVVTVLECAQSFRFEDVSGA